MNYWELMAAYEKLTAERDSALAQNAELMAQVEALKGKVFAAYNFQLNVNADNKSGVLQVFEMLGDAFQAAKITPTQHLRDRDAEVGRAGFVAGFYKAKQVYDCELGQCATELDEMASDYAEKQEEGDL